MARWPLPLSRCIGANCQRRGTYQTLYACISACIPVSLSLNELLAIAMFVS